MPIMWSGWCVGCNKEGHEGASGEGDMPPDAECPQCREARTRHMVGLHLPKIKKPEPDPEPVQEELEELRDRLERIENYIQQPKYGNGIGILL